MCLETLEVFQARVFFVVHHSAQPVPDTRSRAALVQLHMTHYHDVLTDDMGWSRALYRWWEWVLPLTARHYSATEPPSVHGDPSTVE